MAAAAAGRHVRHHDFNEPVALLFFNRCIGVAGAYYACTSFADHLVGRALRTLEELDYAKNTIVLLTGDHVRPAPLLPDSYPPLAFLFVIVVVAVPVPLRSSTSVIVWFLSQQLHLSDAGSEGSTDDHEPLV